MWLQIALDISVCVLFVLLLWIPLGRKVLALLGRDALPVDLPVSLALGMAAWGFCVFGMGLIGIFYRSIVVGLALLLFTALGLNRYLRIPKNVSPEFSATPAGGFWPVCSIALASGFLILVLGSAFAPELAFDSLNVHLPYARDVALSHRMRFSPNNWSSVMPALPLMTYATAFLFSGVSLAKLFNVVCYAACAGVTWSFARRTWGTTHAALATLLFMSCPVALYEATTALIDLPVTLFSTIAVFAILEWSAGNKPQFLWLSSVALGLALGCKYHAAFWLAPIGIILLLQAFESGRSGGKAQWSRIGAYFLIVALLFLPWLARAWFYTGNPVFPMANGLFKSRYFTPAMEAAAVAAYANEGVGRSVPALLKLPWTVVFHPAPFRGTPGLIFLPGILLVAVRRKTPVVRQGLLLSACYFFAWAITAQEIRYLLPLIPLLSVLTAAGILGVEPVGLGSALKEERVRQPLLKRFLMASGFLLVAVSAVVAFPPVYRRVIHEWTYWHSYQSPFAYLFGQQSAQEFASRDVPSIYVYDFINRNLHPGDRILLLNDASQFYSRIPTLYSFTVEGEQILLQSEESQLLQKLKESRISHILLNYNGIAPLPGVAPREGVYFFLDKGFQERSLEPIYSKNNVVLYRVRMS